MRVVGLISGGKDSLYSLYQCVQAGHQVIALANLSPPSTNDEIDSYCYQTVGHNVINAVADAFISVKFDPPVDTEMMMTVCNEMDVELYIGEGGIPLFRRKIKGKSSNLDLSYEKTDGDEVEDLYTLLHCIKV